MLCGMLLASRGIVGGIEWCKENAEDPAIGKTAEKAKKQFAGREIKGKTLGVIGLVRSALKLRTQRSGLGMEVMGYDPFVSVNAAWKVLPAVQHVTDLAISIANAITSPSMCQRSMHDRHDR